MRVACRIEDLEIKDAKGRSRVECIPDAAGRQPGEKDGDSKSTATSSTNIPAANRARSAGTFISNKLELGATLPQFVVENTTLRSIDGPTHMVARNDGFASPYSSPFQTNSTETAYRPDENRHQAERDMQPLDVAIEVVAVPVDPSENGTNGWTGRKSPLKDWRAWLLAIIVATVVGVGVAAYMSANVRRDNSIADIMNNGTSTLDLPRVEHESSSNTNGVENKVRDDSEESQEFADEIIQKEDEGIASMVEFAYFERIGHACRSFSEGNGMRGTDWILHEDKTFEWCKEKCTKIKSCKGLEWRSGDGRCEIWTTKIDYTEVAGTTNGRIDCLSKEPFI